MTVREWSWTAFAILAMFVYMFGVSVHIFDTFDKFCRIYVAHKFVLHHSMAAREMGDIKEMALRQKFELSIFQQRPQGVCIYKQILNEYFEGKKELSFCQASSPFWTGHILIFPSQTQIQFSLSWNSESCLIRLTSPAEYESLRKCVLLFSGHLLCLNISNLRTKLKQRR